MRRTKPSVHVTSRAHQIRILFILLGFIIIFASIGLRLYHLQCIQYKKYRVLADNQHIVKSQLPAKRGAIYDRNGKELAISIESYDVICSPEAIAQVKKGSDKLKKNIDVKLAKELASILHQPEPELLKLFTTDTTSQRRIIAREIDLAQYQQLQNIIAKYRIRNEIGFEPVSKRYYPKKELACHIIGSVGIGYSDERYKVRHANRGLTGIEQKQQKNICGSFAVIQTVVDALGKPITPVDDSSLLSVQGEQLYLTIDETIQYVAERVLAETIKKHKAAGGSVIVMEPNTGEILALANEPKYDLNRFCEYAKKPELWKNISRNRAVEDVIEPGSIAKIFTAAAALEENVVSLTDKFYGYNGKIVFCNRVLRDTHPYAWLTFPEIIEVSSNIGIHQVAQRIPPATFRQYLINFGFGNRTGIELPGETYGVVPALNQWTPLTMSRIAFGQSISMSPIQITCALAAIANGGMLMKPRIVKGIYDAKGNKIKESKPEPVRRVISELTAKTLARIMEGVVERGTGTLAKLDGYRVAGKTGTAQVVSDDGRGYKSGKYNSSFIGFVPAESPRIVISVIINEPSCNGYYGGTVAAPAFKKIACEVLTQLGVNLPLPVIDTDSTKGNSDLTIAQKLPESIGNDKNNVDKPIVSDVPYPSDSPEGQRIIDGNIQLVNLDGKIPNSVPTSSLVLMPDVKGMTKRKVAYLFAQYKIPVRYVGSGIAVFQNPPAGEALKPGTNCVIYFSNLQER
ncbi:MAG: transpeptidase family protein [bacterium]|nr:transpeptidase family protein [bacterium]